MGTMAAHPDGASQSKWPDETSSMPPSIYAKTLKGAHSSDDSGGQSANQGMGQLGGVLKGVSSGKEMNPAYHDVSPTGGTGPNFGNYGGG